MAIIDLPIADQRAAVVAEALSWQGTRYMHRGMCKVVRNAADTIVDPGGVDCATLLIAIFQAVGFTGHTGIHAMPLTGTQTLTRM